MAIFRQQVLTGRFGKDYKKGEKIKEKYLHYVRVFKVVGRENLQFKLVWYGVVFLAGVVLRFFHFFLVVDQVGDYIRLSNINKETITYNNRSRKFGESSIALAEVSDLILSIDWVELNVELSARMIGASAHHWINRRLILTCIRIIWVIHGNYKIVHSLLEDLLPSGSIFNISSSGSSSILGTILSILFVLVLGSIFHTEICVAVELLSSWTVVIPQHIRSIIVVNILLWNNS